MQVTRKHYRKTLSSSGRMAVYGEMLKFNTMDISAGGAKVHMHLISEINNPLPVGVFLDELQSQGAATVVWSKPDDEGGCFVGLKFDRMHGNADKFQIYG